MTGWANTLVGQRSRSRIAPFRLHRPSSVDEAVDAMASAPTGAAYMAGGIDLINRMKAGFTPGEVIHVARIAELARISEKDGSVCLGSCATHREVSEHEILRTRAPELARCWRELGNPRVRSKGTVGGNVMAREPGYDAALMLMAADATLTFATSHGPQADVPIAQASAAEDLLTTIENPAARSLHLRVDRSLHPVLTLAVGVRERGAYIERAQVAIGGAYEVPAVFPLGLSEPISRADLANRAGAIALEFAQRLAPPLNDWRGSSSYRLRMIGVVLGRLLREEGMRPC